MDTEDLIRQDSTRTLDSPCMITSQWRGCAMKGRVLLLFLGCVYGGHDLFAWESMWGKSYYHTLGVSESSSTKGAGDRC